MNNRSFLKFPHRTISSALMDPVLTHKLYQKGKTSCHSFGLHFPFSFLHFSKKQLFRFYFHRIKTYHNRRSLSHCGFRIDSVTKTVTDHSAQIKPDSGGLLVKPSCQPRIAVFKYPRQILRTDSDARIAYHKRQRLPHIDRNRSAGSIFK